MGAILVIFIVLTYRPLAVGIGVLLGLACALGLVIAGGSLLSGVYAILGMAAVSYVLSALAEFVLDFLWHH